MKSTPTWLPSSSFLILASTIMFTLTSSLTFNLLPDKVLTFSDQLNLFLLTTALSGNICSLFLSGFAHALEKSKDHVLKNDHVMISSVGAVQAGVIILSVLKRITPVETFIIFSIFQIWSTFLFFSIVTESIETPKKTITQHKYIYALVVTLFTMVAYPLRNWFPINSLMVSSSMWQSLTVSLGLVSTLVVLSWSKGTPWKNQFLYQSIKQHFEGNLSGVKRKIFFNVSLISSLIPFGLGIALNIANLLNSREVHLQPNNLQSWVLGGFSFLFIPSLLLCWGKIKEQSKSHSELTISSKLAGKSAERFLRRNLRDENSWAASIGLRTSIFTVDHDPEDTLIRALPSSLIQIRNEEINRCINDVLGGRTLHSQVVGQRILGALDPELSTRPCIDIIKMFAALYLDAGPLIERRINGLGTLLPIVNPGLANILRSNNTSDLLKRAQWFFHLDYRWVDQNLINTPQATRYGVHMDPLANELRHAMISHLRKSNALGSFLWMGREAQTRLLQEAPMLASIIEPVTVSGTQGGDHLVFTLKFETLIPRLQRYFELDKLRNILMDYDISPDASKLINIFRAQSAQAHSAESMLNMVESVSAYPWRGFKEKDQALKLIVTAHQFSSQIITECNERNEDIPAEILKLNESIQLNVEKIGYPAQILHLAQMHKIALRDVVTLLNSAKNAKDSRFEESWTLLGNLDLSRYPRPERKLIAEFLTSSKALRALLEEKDIPSKAIDAIVNLAKSELQLKDYTLGLDSAIEGLIDEFVKLQPSPETLTILLDGMSYLSELSERVVPNAGSPAYEQLGVIINRHENSSLPYAQALGNRWRERKQKMKVAA